MSINKTLIRWIRKLERIKEEEEQRYTDRVLKNLAKEDEEKEDVQQSKDD